MEVVFLQGVGSARLVKALENAGFKTVGQVVDHVMKDADGLPNLMDGLMKIKGIGYRSALLFLSNFENKVYNYER